MSALDLLARVLGGKLNSDLEDFRRPHAISERDEGGYVAKNFYLWEPKSLRIRTINLWHVFLAEYLQYGYYIVIAITVWLLASQLYSGGISYDRIKELTRDPIVLETVFLVSLVFAYFFRSKPSVYCMENIVSTPPKEWQLSQDDLMKCMQAQDCFTEESLDFQRRLLDRSGTGPTTHWPPGTTRSIDGKSKAVTDMCEARREAEAIVFPLVRQILEKTGVSPQSVDFVIINCSLFCPTPSLCAMVCNEFRFRENVRTYNLGGMGCSANVISVDLAEQLLQNQPGTRALVVSTENLTRNLYTGNQKAMLLQNTLFRCGGCALLLSSRWFDAARAKYKLLYTVRAQVSEDKSYSCVYQQQDCDGNLGVALSKDIVSVAGQAMKRNFVQLAPYVLPLREQAKVVYNQVAIKLISHAKKAGWPGADSWTVPAGYTPKFCKGIDHFCIHAGGRAVIEGVQVNLSLTDEQVRPSFETLHNWGNTSSSSIWYEADWVERFGGLRRGDRMLQIAFGSGFKCNSAVWVALKVDRSKVMVPLKTGLPRAYSKLGLDDSGRLLRKDGASSPAGTKLV